MVLDSIASVHCREEGCIGLYIPVDQWTAILIIPSLGMLREIHSYQVVSTVNDIQGFFYMLLHGCS